jgi:hypothetical protein
MSKRVLWVVEIQEPDGSWFPTDDTELSREDARGELSNWKGRFPGERFRVAKYEATEGR